MAESSRTLVQGRRWAAVLISNNTYHFTLVALEVLTDQQGPQH